MSEAFKIQGLAGAHKLSGAVRVAGAKNAALKIVAATILFRDKVTLTNIPEINDIERMFDLLSDLGAKISHPKSDTYEVSIPADFKTVLTPEIAKRFRGSVVATGPILSRFGKVSFPYPGGCLIGARPIDLFLEGFEKMGAQITLNGSAYDIEAPAGGLRGAEFFLKKQSVTVTETFMMAAVLAKGTTVIKNAAMEPEIEDLAKFLNRCGAKISGMGTPMITIRGGKLLSGKGRVYKTMPDRIDAGSFLVLGALAAKELRITNCNPLHLEALIETLRSAGVEIETTKT
ncbi:MAG: UDP-N-acetylglucosamine 1-carboxyvinyltransferase, partial [Parcubacteria group bacterium GW2011_GWA1_47_8]